MLPSAGTLDNVTKTIGRLLDGYDIRLRPNFGGKYWLTITKPKETSNTLKIMLWKTE